MIRIETFCFCQPKFNRVGKFMEISLLFFFASLKPYSYLLDRYGFLVPEIVRRIHYLVYVITVKDNNFGF